MARSDVLARLAFDDDVFVVEYSSIVDLVAVGTANSVHVVLISSSYTASVITTFRVASRVTALAWGPASLRQTGDGSSASVKLLAACADKTLRILSHDTSSVDRPLITPIGPASRSSITSVAWCPVSGSSNLILSGATDGTVLLWNLSPPSDPSSPPQPTASLIAKIPRPVRTVSFHRSQSHLVMIHDASNSIRIVDWTKESRPTVMLLHDPAGLVQSGGGEATSDAGWMAKDQAVFGSVSGGRWAVWDTRTTAGGTPARTGDSWTNGANGSVFKWCPTHTGLFAVASSSPPPVASGVGAVHVHRLASPDSPTTLRLPSERIGLRSRVHGISWQPEGDQVLCVAVGRELVWLLAGTASDV